MKLSHLNPPQRDAVLSTEGPLLVLAGAGSGKTRVITHRIAHLLERKVPGSAVLAVTFTNKAAQEMRERVSRLAGAAAAEVGLMTFHAFGASVLREHLAKLGYPKRVAIADTSDQLALIRRAMRDRQVDHRTFDARRVLAIISRAKNCGGDPQVKPEGQGDDYDLAAHLVWGPYQLALKAQGAVDFDDLLLLPARLFEERPEVKAAYAKRYRYVMVDEYQDTNAAQLALLRHLTARHGNVCVVGDDDQCIYSWRGAQLSNILEFERSFPGGKAIRLEQNYRSTQPILEVANAVIAKNPNRRPKRMWTEAPGGRKPLVVCAPTEEEEARWVAAEIARTVATGTRPEEIAVLYRVNGQARPVEEALRERGVRYQVIGGTEFFDQREVKDVVAYLKAIANPNDEVSLRRIINVPARGIGDVTVDRISAWAQEREIALTQALARVEEVPGLPLGAADKVQAFTALMRRYRSAFATGELGVLTAGLLEEIDYLGASREVASTPAAADRRAAAVREVLASLNAYSRRDARASLGAWLNALALDARDQEEDPQRQAGQVTLMTLHGAKGLEWEHVFLVGVEEDLLPHSGMQGELPNPEEERRLCYVGMTRARSRLVLTRAASRLRRGKEVPRTPSRFLADLPDGSFDALDLDAPPPGPPSEREQSFFATLRARLKAPSDPSNLNKSQ